MEDSNLPLAVVLVAIVGLVSIPRFWRFCINECRNVWQALLLFWIVVLGAITALVTIFKSITT